MSSPCQPVTVKHGLFGNIGKHWKFGNIGNIWVPNFGTMGSEYPTILESIFRPFFGTIRVSDSLLSEYEILESVTHQPVIQSDITVVSSKKDSVVIEH